MEQPESNEQKAIQDLGQIKQLCDDAMSTIGEPAQLKMCMFLNGIFSFAIFPRGTTPLHGIAQVESVY